MVDTMMGVQAAKRMCQAADGGVDHHKVWSNVAYLTATVVFAKIGWLAQPSDGLAWLFLVYLSTVGGSQIANRFLENKYGPKPANGDGNGGGDAH